MFGISAPSGETFSSLSKKKKEKESPVETMIECISILLFATSYKPKSFWRMKPSKLLIPIVWKGHVTRYCWPLTSSTWSSTFYPPGPFCLLALAQNFSQNQRPHPRSSRLSASLTQTRSGLGSAIDCWRSRVSTVTDAGWLRDYSRSLTMFKKVVSSFIWTGYLLLNFSGCFSRIRWKRWAMEASCRRESGRLPTVHQETKNTR